MIKHLEFHTGIDDMVTIGIWGSWLNFIEQIRMVANFLQLHQNIEQLNSVFTWTIHRINISCDYSFVKLFLQLRQSYKHVNFFFGLDVCFDVDLEPSQHEWFQQTMNLFYDGFLLLWIFFILIMSYHEKIVEIIRRFKKLRHKEVEEGPQLFQVILKWRSCQQKPISCFQSSQIFGEHTVNIFDSLCFIKNKIFEIDLS